MPIFSVVFLLVGLLNARRWRLLLGGVFQKVHTLFDGLLTLDFLFPDLLAV